MIHTTIQGIPCQAEMTGGHYQKPDHTTWDSDWDYYGGWFDVTFEIYDRKGYRAKWLEKKMTHEDEEKIINALLEHVGDD
jgi:hypothetical protein